MSQGLRSQNIDARKKFQFKLEIDGVNSAAIMKCDMPEVEYEIGGYGGGNMYETKQPGRMKVAPLNFEKLLISRGADLALWKKFLRAGDPLTGQATPPSQLKEDMELLHTDESGRPIEKWILHGAWIQKLGGDAMEGSSDFLLEKGTIVYDWPERVAVNG